MKLATLNLLKEVSDMKKYTTPEVELLVFAAADMMAGSDEYETTPDPYTFTIQDIKDI